MKTNKYYKKGEFIHGINNSNIYHHLNNNILPLHTGNNYIGGKVISEGAYGCVFRPSINCNGKQNKNNKYVSKIQVYDDTAINEIEISKKINKYVNRKDLMFAPIESACDVNINKIKDSTKEECNILKKKRKRYVNMRIRFVDKLIFFEYMKQESNKNILNIFLDNFNYLMLSISKLIENNIIHMDLKGNNILVDTKKNIPIIIDFGLSIDFNKLTGLDNAMEAITKNREKSISTFISGMNINNSYLNKCFYVYGPDYYVWCPEIHYINYLVNVNDSPNKDEIKQICNSIIDGIVVLKRLYNDEFINKMKLVLYNYYERFYKKPRDECILDLLQYANTWDTYSLSMIFLRILSYIISNIENLEDKYRIKNNGEFIKSFSKILLYNIHPNPSKRYTIENNIDKINEYIYYKSPDDTLFLNKIKNINPTNKEIVKLINKDEKYMSMITKTIDK